MNTEPEQLGLGLQDETRLEARFREWLDANPKVYVRVVELAREWRARHGLRPVGIGMLWERMRWDMSMALESDAQGFALNNSYRSRMARLVLKQEPDLLGIFETRELKS